MVTEQKTLCRNLAILQKSIVQIHQQQCGLALRTMSKGTQTRLAQIPEQAKFLMNRFVTDLSTDVLQVDHSTMTLPVGRDRNDNKANKLSQMKKKSIPPPPPPQKKTPSNFNRLEYSHIVQIKCTCLEFTRSQANTLLRLTSLNNCQHLCMRGNWKQQHLSCLLLDFSN